MPGFWVCIDAQSDVLSDLGGFGLASGVSPPRILVAADMREGRLLATRVLTLAGFEVREAVDGQEALQVWQQWQPRLVLMDMRMPTVDGREATRRIKSTPQGSRTIVIALTASSFEEEHESIMAAGCDDYMRKPFDNDRLVETVARHLRLELRYDPEPAGERHPVERRELLSTELRRSMQNALQRLDVAAVEAALREIQAADPACADTLRPFIQHFDYANAAAVLAARASAPEPT